MAPSFGECLLHAATSLLDAGHDAVCLLNSDSPTLPIAYLIAAATVLAAPGDRIVLGPSTDGGYYLIGLKQPHRRLFEDIDWSTERVAAQTLARARELGLPVHQLPSWYDVDDVDALRMLVRRAVRGPPFPRLGKQADAGHVDATRARAAARQHRSGSAACRFACHRASSHDQPTPIVPIDVRWPHVRLAAIGRRACRADGRRPHPASGLRRLGAHARLRRRRRGRPAGARRWTSADQRGALIVILVGAVAMRLALLFVEPYLSTDIYRYVWDGRVQAAGINPYRYVPSAPELAHLRDAAIFPNINRADYAVTIYPPTAQAIFLAVTRFGESVVAMKLGLIAFEAATVAALLALLQRQGSAGDARCGLRLAPAADLGDRRQRPRRCRHVRAADGRPAAVPARPHPARGRRRHAGRAGQADGAAGSAGVLAAMELAAAACRGAHRAAGLPALPVGRPRRVRLPVGLRRGGGPGVRPRHSTCCGSWSASPGPCRAQARSTLPLRPPILIGLAIAVAFRKDRSDRAAIACLSWLLVAFLILASPHYPWYFLVLVPLLVARPVGDRLGADARLPAPLRQRRRRGMAELRRAHRRSSCWRPLPPLRTTPGALRRKPRQPNPWRDPMSARSDRSAPIP